MNEAELNRIELRLKRLLAGLEAGRAEAAAGGGFGGRRSATPKPGGKKIGLPIFSYLAIPVMTTTLLRFLF